MPTEYERVPGDSPVWLRLRADTATLEAAVAARWLLVKRADSLRTLPDGTRLPISELDLWRPAGKAEVVGRTWRRSHQGRALLSFEYRDGGGGSGTLDAWLEAGAIEQVYVYREMAPAAGQGSGAAARDARKSGYKAVLILVGPIAGGLAGLAYGKMKGDGGNSQPGMSAYTYSLVGMAMGLWFGIQAAVLD